MPDEKKLMEIEERLSKFYGMSSNETEVKWKVSSPGLEDMVPLMREVLTEDKANMMISMMKNLEVGKVTIMQAALTGILGVTPKMMHEFGNILLMVAGDTKMLAEGFIEVATEKEAEIKAEGKPTKEEQVH